MKSVLAIAAHPDDIEFLMAGTLLHLRDAGYALHYMNLANGCCGSTRTGPEETAATRLHEARNAAAKLGATFYEPICNDLEIFYNAESLQQVASVVRAAQPEIVLTHAPADYMEDHTSACRLAVTAAFSRGMPNFPTRPERAIYTGDITVYHAQPYTHRDPLGELVRPGIFVNVTQLQNQKRELLSLHESQKQWLDESQGLDSYLDTMQQLDAELGRMSTLYQYAEGWRRHHHIGFCAADADPLSKALKTNAFPRPPQE